MTRKKTNYSFEVKYLLQFQNNPYECPCCGTNLSKENALTVKSNSVNKGKPFTTNVGKGQYDGYVMDQNSQDATLVLSDPNPDVSCSNCQERLDPDQHQE